MNCELCGAQFDKISQLYNHRGYYKGKCLERIQSKQQKLDEKEQRKKQKLLSTMEPTEIVEEIKNASQTNALLHELGQNISEMKEQSNAISKEHLKIITKHETLLKQIKNILNLLITNNIIL